MMRSLIAAAALLAAIAPVTAQNLMSGALYSPVSLRCSALADMDPAEQTNSVLYIAGYYDGQRDALATGSVVETPQAPDAMAVEGDVTRLSEGSAPPAAAPTAATVLPTIAIETILETCAQSPDSRIADIITAHSGAAGE